MNDCIGILYSDSEFMDLTGFLILAPPVVVGIAIVTIATSAREVVIVIGIGLATHPLATTTTNVTVKAA